MARIQRRITAYFLSFNLLVSSFWQVQLPHKTIVSTQIQTPVPLKTTVPVTFTNESYGIVGQIGGPTQAVAVAGNFVFLGVGSRLTVLDISNPASPYERSSTPPFGSPVESVEVRNTTAYVSAGNAGLYIIDISNPAQPVIIGNYDSPGYTEGVSVVGQHAYVADGPAGLRVIDITDQTHPVEVSAVYKLNYAFDVVVAAGYAYVAGAGAGLLVAGVSNPLQPQETGSLNTPGYAFGVALSGDTAYVADGWGGMRIVDVSSPVQPVDIGVYQTEGWAYCVATAGSTAYVADSFHALQVLDISAPGQPRKLGSYAMLGDHVSKLAISPGKVYVASRNQGLIILDINTPNNPVRIGAYHPIGFAASVDVAGQYAYVSAGSYGLRIMDISDPSRPREIGAYATPAYATVVVAAGTYVYVFTVSSGESIPAGMHVVDVSNPTKPRQVAFYVGAGMPRDVISYNGVLYVANEAGIEAIDVSTPAVPFRLGSIDFSQGDDALLTHATWGVAISGNRAYVTHADFGIEVVDISDPANMRWVGNFKSSVMVKTQAVTVGGHYAFVSDVSTLHILDISNPDQPVAAGTYELPMVAEKMALTADTLYLANAGAGLLALDVSNPQTPVLEGQLRLPDYALWVSAGLNNIFIADGEAGLFILEEPATQGQVSLASFDESSEPGAEMEFISSMPLQAGYSQALPPVQPVRVITQWLALSPAGDEAIDLFFPLIYKHRSNRTLTVTSTADSGPGTLREVIELANQATGGATILFDPQIFPPQNPATIYPSSGLPGLLSGNVIIDASNAGVILDGSQALPDTTGLGIPSDHNIVRGLQVVNFPGYGIHVLGAGNIIGGDRKLGRGPMGQGNLVSGNGSAGVILATVDAVKNRVIGNYIGTDLTGEHAAGNLIVGVFMTDGASLNIIGGESEAERNLISGNVRSEVSIFERANRNKVVGNYLSTNATGQVRLGIAVMGLSMELGAFNNVVQANVIGNSVVVADWGGWGNSVIGNFIGVDPTGTVPIGGGGVSVGSFNRIGGTEPEERNIISGNSGMGIALGGSSTFVIGNYIGTDVTGTSAVGNQGHGITSYAGIKHTFIGGTSPGERNLISGNESNGIDLETIGTDENFIIGNFIGTDASGLNELPNHEAGIQMGDGDHNFVQSNLIANNPGSGLHLMSGEDNRIHHNSFINNGANDGGVGNQWDDGIEGNYWSDYEGTDANGDGIGDTPYSVPSNGVDNYPLMEPFYITRR